MPPNAAPIYYGHPFSCGCGDAHILNANIEVPREIPGKNKFVAGCPNDENVLNFLKVRGMFRIVGLDAICSTRISSDQDLADLCNGVVQAQTGCVLNGPF